jgi:hypothetical protein
MKFVAALLASIATLSAANPLPLDSDAKKALVARTSIVSVTYPSVSNAGQVTYSVGNIDEAFTIGSEVLRPPLHRVKGSNGMYQSYTSYCFIYRRANTSAHSR